jgi:hypothetical protein
MDLLALLNRFQFYAIQNKSLRHNPAVPAETAFVNFDWEELSAAVETAVKFPCLFLQTPDIEKDGLDQDSLHETYELTFMVLDFMADGDYANKPIILQKCKTITDSLYNRMQVDAGVIFDSEMSKTQEGAMKATGLIGWSVTLAFNQGYDRTVDNTQWLDLP